MELVAITRANSQGAVDHVVPQYPVMQKEEKRNAHSHCFKILNGRNRIRFELSVK